MLLVGLTGGIGSGKSTVAAMLAARGAEIIDGDVIVRELQRPGSPVLALIGERFGDGVLDGDQLDRQALADIVFNDPEALSDLNGIVHPPLGEEIQRRVEAARDSDRIVVLDFPLLAEKPRSDLDATIVVDVDEELAIERLVSWRGMDEADANARIANQASRERRRAIATHVIDNSGDLAELAVRVDAVWADLVASNAGRREL